MIRILRTELRRSTALWLAPAMAVLGAAMLVVLLDDWGSRWTALALWQREYLYILWPLALGAGAWAGRRESRSRMLELLGTTARPSWQRVIPTAGAMAIAVVVGYLGMFAAGGAQVASTASFFPPGSILVVAVGALSLVAAVWLGLGIGRLLPSAFTPPALVVIGLMVLLSPPMINYWLTKGEADPAAILLSPTLSPIYDKDYVAVAASLHFGQALWFVALAATGFALFASAGLRNRLVALVPACVGVAVALAVLPASTQAAATVPDRKAAAPMCTTDTPKVCVTAVHGAALDDLRGPARQALQILAKKLPQAPTSVAESPTSWLYENSRPQPADTLLVELWIKEDGAPRTLEPDLLWELLDGAGTRRCANTVNDHTDGRHAVAAWLRDEDPLYDGESKKILDALRALPAAEQTNRVAAFRKATLACENRDLNAILTGTGAP